MNIETERLKLIPLTPKQLKLWIEDLPAIERDLHCFYRAEPLEGGFLEVVKGQAEIAEKNPDDYLWNTFWLLIRKADRAVVGSIVFKGIRGDWREAEIGYGLGKEFEHNGLMTEAVRAICDWALKQSGVFHIIAETDADGFASQRVLRRCGFTEKKRGEMIWWKL